MLVLGATGFVGRHVRPALEEAGWDVRLATRRPGSARERYGDGDWVRFDVEDPRSFAMQDCDAMLYLVHQMRADGEDLIEREQRSARHVAELAAEAGIQRIVYLGAPETENASHHLEARHATGRALREGPVTTIELQAAMIVGPGSESWWICRDLALRLPAMTLPPWAASKSQPVAIDDVVAALVRALDMPVESSTAFALPGPEVLSAEQILRRVAQQAGISPWMVHVPFLTPSLSSHWLRFVTRADIRVARQLVDGLEHDLVVDGEGFWAHAPDLPRTTFDEAVRRTLEVEGAPTGRFARTWERLIRRAAPSG